jgi:hypothetical protein
MGITFARWVNQVNCFVLLVDFYTFVLLFWRKLLSHNTWRGGRVAESTGLLNRRTGKPVPGVRIPLSPRNCKSAEQAE